MSVQTILLAVLAILTVIYLIVFVLDLIKHKNDSEKGTNFIVMSVIGFVINFFDVFGIGSFATGTALMFINGVEVEPVTLASMIVAAVVGAYLGAGVVAKLPTKVIRLLMGTALIVIGIVIVIQMMGLIPSSGVATGLSGIKLVIGIAANFILGALMTAGVGMYAPCLALVCLLGINPMIAFPIMMGSSAYLMPVASLKFIKEGAYNRKASLAIAIFGIFGVFIGYRFIKMLNLNALKFIIIIVMAYSAVSLFYSAYKDSKK